ncbi:quinoprotein dehydrogenase-associated SoxYZ-like carrier [Sedimentitalea arenosa]|uniref:Quinoprotein dehydrogenase-associated SoxYZ-like carrier n=1 Tax=Sedimentitalea arenosa TaxID=2798803 RepID=A0A8J7IM57_9RHOB|nr:quinoprotein dehydrogenase-associated SoxYZ-like carrier [Arenibacterium arenosum]MBJ6373203.1 quinoprotein dehydrogenase-associated SoxYZ-like carrier [Arenibacterium arenosum]
MLRPLLAALSLATAAAAADDVRTPLTDPLGSGMWSYHQKELLGDPLDIRFDDRVIVQGPANAEDTVNVPLLVDATAIGDVEEIRIFADYGPIPHILTYHPGQAAPKIALRFKIDQATAIRAAVRSADGAWHVGSTYIDAAGGGCTAASHAYASDDWEERLGMIHGQVWADTGRARMIVDHPMDTGLADGIPVFIIETLDISDTQGQPIARLDLHEPVNEDPAFTLYFEPDATPEALRITGRDNNGNDIDGLITVAGYNG